MTYFNTLKIKSQNEMKNGYRTVIVSRCENQHNMENTSLIFLEVVSQLQVMMCITWYKV